MDSSCLGFVPSIRERRYSQSKIRLLNKFNNINFNSITFISAGLNPFVFIFSTSISAPTSSLLSFLSTRRSVEIHLDGRVVEHGDVGDDVDGRSVVNVHDKADAGVGIGRRAVRNDVFDTDSGIAGLAVLVAGWVLNLEFRYADENDGILIDGGPVVVEVCATTLEWSPVFADGLWHCGTAMVR